MLGGLNHTKNPFNNNVEDNRPFSVVEFQPTLEPRTNQLLFFPSDFRH
jgi:hypothetical protein